MPSIDEFSFREVRAGGLAFRNAARDALARILGWGGGSAEFRALPELVHAGDLPSLASFLGLEWRENWPEPLRHQPAVVFYDDDRVPGCHPHYYSNLATFSEGLDLLPLHGLMVFPGDDPRLLRELLMVAVGSLGVGLSRFASVSFHGEYRPETARLLLRNEFTDLNEEIYVLAHEVAHILDVPPDPSHSATEEEVCMSEHIAYEAAAVACEAWGLDFVSWAEQVRPHDYVGRAKLTAAERASAHRIAERLLETVAGL